MAETTGSNQTPLVYSFDSPPPGDPASWPAIVGGKGAGLASMWRQGIPVPPGFTIPTSVGQRVVDEGWFDELDAAVRQAMDELERSLGRTLGQGEQALLVSVRSGAPVSMPGMMDTVLNVGMSAEAAGALSRWGGDERFGWDTYRRFIESFASIVAECPRETVDRLWLDAAGRPADDLDAATLAAAVARFRGDLAGNGYIIPDDPYEQVTAAAQAVFRSWQAPRAVAYRQHEGLSASLGTAATVQAMVFGNLGPESGTGVVFTRDPSTGAPGLMGDFLPGGQGEDVVAGTHETQPIAALAARWPAIADELGVLATRLERDLADVADIEFTVESGVLWILQARVGKRSPQAAMRLAVAMAEEPDFPLDRAGAVARVGDLLKNPPLLASTVPDADDATVLARGLAASPGWASGRVCVDPDEALRRAEAGEEIVLVRRETSPADVHGMAVAKGLVTLLGGLVSHAAVVARSWGIPAVVGVDGLTITDDGIVVGSWTLGPDELITVDGDGGRILLGEQRGTAAEMPEAAVLRSWRDELQSTLGRSEVGVVDQEVTAASGRWSGPVTVADCLRVLALKGMATEETVASTLGADVAATALVLVAAVEAGEAQVGPGDRFLLTPEGTTAVDASFGAEAVAAKPAIEPHLEHFHRLNGRFKEVVTGWQMRDVAGEQVMNDHTDAEYDGAILIALADEIHVGIVAILAEIALALPRLGAYALRLTAALDGVVGGDRALMAHPLRDSYHTVWFELHEELIRLSGRNRADETAAGRA